MCGLVGAFSSPFLSANELDTFTNLLYCSALRGNDSTGVMLVTEDGKYDHFKAAVDPSTFINNQLPILLNKYKGKITGIFGHTRLATTGKIKHSNSHPFLIRKEVMMMHNGNVQYAPGVSLKDYEVDSMALAASLHKHEDPRDVFEKFFGAAAVLWFDIRNNTFNVFRNTERPLAYHQVYGTTYIASEKKMLEWVMSKSRNYGECKEVESGKIFSYSTKDFKKAPEVVNVPFVSRHSHRGYGRDTDGITTSPHRHHSDHQPAKIIHLPRNDKSSHISNIETSADNFENINIVAKESPLMFLKDYGPFEIGDALLCCPIAWQEFKGENRTSYRIELSPLGLNWTDEYRSKFGDIKIFFTNHKEETALEVYNSEIISGTISNIRYDRSKPDMKDRLVVYISNAKRHGVYHG